MYLKVFFHLKALKEIKEADDMELLHLAGETFCLPGRVNVGV